MLNEPGKIVQRRFMNRILESGLLVLAVALGVGAAASGFSLLATTQTFGEALLASPEYREIVVSTQDKADEMESPVVKKPNRENIALGVNDLRVSEIIPTISQAYIANESEIRFINQAQIERLESGQGFGGPGGGGPGGAPPGEGGGPGVGDNGPGPGDGADAESPPPDETGEPSDAPSNGTPPQEAGTLDQAPGQGQIDVGQTPGQLAAGTQNNTFSQPGSNAQSTQGQAPGQNPGQAPGPRGIDLDELKKSEAEGNLFITELERMKGFQVSPAFFDAWSMHAAEGSLFTEDDQKSDQSLIILGSEAAKALRGNDQNNNQKGASLLGKKILTWGSYRSVVGILEPTGNSKYDSSFFQAYRLFREGEGGGNRRWARNTQLRFAVTDPETLLQTEASLRDWFETKYGVGQIVISNPRQEAKNLVNRNSGIGLLILFLSLAGLFIAALNVSNILLSRGIRMRKNTGILMALGASKEKILLLFGGEGLVISALGSGLGALLALPLSHSMETALGMSSNESWIYLILGILLSGILILGATLLPAWQNSRCQPADAMRSV